MHGFWSALATPFRFLLGLPLRVVHGARRLWGLSLPTAVAWGVFFVLTVLAITFYVVGYIMVRNSASTFGPLKNPLELVLVLVLLIAIPLAVYQALKLWLEGDHVPFPDIDRAWRDGLTALHRQGFELEEMPIFLVVGAPDPQQCDAMMKASGWTLAVNGLPEGRQPLRWYSDGNTVFLFCVGIGHLGQLNLLVQTQPVGTAGTGGLRQTAVPTSAPGGAGDAQAAAYNIRGTLISGAAASSPTPAQAAAPAPAPSDGGVRGTMVPGAGGAPAGGGNAGGGGAPRSYSMSRVDIDEQTERLKYVGYLLRRERDPFCPLNGILTVLPYPVLQNVVAAAELPVAVKGDMVALREQTRLNCPVTALVVDMESEPGFSELVRRVGLQRAKSNRFGKGFDVWNAASKENMDALSSHACGAFEDWVYSLFREENGLHKPGNAKLFSLLCRVRSEMLVRLRNVLVQAFGHDGQDDDGLLFSGCYFAATGASEDQQAFVKNVFEKMVSLEEDLDWTDSVVVEDQRHRSLARTCIVGIGGLLAGLVLMFLYQFVWQGLGQD